MFYKSWSASLTKYVLQHFTQILHQFYQFPTTVFGLQIGPCQRSHIFGCDFQNYEKSTHLGSLPRPPSGTFLDPLGRHGPPSNNKMFGSDNTNVQK